MWSYTYASVVVGEIPLKSKEIHQVSDVRPSKATLVKLCAKSLYFCLTKNITAIVIFALHKHHFFFAPSCCIFPTLERHNLSRMVDEACGLGCNRLDKGIFADVRELLATDTAVVAHLAHQLASIIQKQ
ncbi:hypothetical protein PV325_006182 [Microctonus aethiopoides]|nr:hypothetical protein PV325_006182 [Microctonus aethiopoides]